MALCDWHVNVTQDCYQFIQLFQKSVHVPWLCRVYMNCTSHLALKNHFNICIQVLTGKLWAEMQNYQISMPILYGGILHTGNSFLLEAPQPLGHCCAHGGLQEAQEEQEKLLSLCAGQGWSWKDQTPLEQWHRLHSARSSEHSVLLDGSEPDL